MHTNNDGTYEPQARKYSETPYIEHPLEVADILQQVGVTDEKILQAAILHDVVEDTVVTIEMVTAEFGRRVAMMVLGLTDPEKVNEAILELPRDKRKAAARSHMDKQDVETQLVKLADLIANTQDILTADPDFAVRYSYEKSTLLKVLVKPLRFTKERNNFNYSSAGQTLYTDAVNALKLYYKQQLDTEFEAYWADSNDCAALAQRATSIPVKTIAYRAYSASYWKRQRPAVIMDLEELINVSPSVSIS
jgi:(p)ppGpp synthase/HD superfamily hydrolase